MTTYAIWNNKGGVGKSYLTFQIASEFAAQHPDTNVLVVDLCPQANASAMLLGGMEGGEEILTKLHTAIPRMTISGYFENRILSPYVSPGSGADFLTQVARHNKEIPDNLYLVVGDEQLEAQASRVSGATNPGPQEAWRIVHLWVKDLILDIQRRWDTGKSIVFIDCNPSFSIYTELALTAAERLLIPFSADGSSKRAVKAVLSLVYGVRRHQGDQQSEFFLQLQRYRMEKPQIYMYIGNRLTQMNQSSATAFRKVVDEIGEEIWGVWNTSPQHFCIHPNGSPTPNSKKTFGKMFQYEVNDANTASVVSSALGIPISKLTAGPRDVVGKSVVINQSQLDKQVPNLRELVAAIE